MNLQEIAPGLVRDPDGYWVAPEIIETSFPAGGHDHCLSFEESSFWFSHRNRAIVAAVRKYPPAHGPIFDVGAGNGYVATALEGAGFPTVAIEPSRAGAAHAAARQLPHVVCGALPSEAFGRETAGGIGLFDVLEHVEDDRSLLASLRPYLKRGGRLYLTTPAYQRLWSSNDVRAGHYRRYTLTSLRDTLAAAGFRVEFESYFFWFLPLPILLFRTLRSDNAPARAARQHRAGGALVRRLATACLAFEWRRIARGASVPFGGSCLVVATVSGD